MVRDFDSDMDFTVSASYLDEPHIQKFINDVEGYVDMTGVETYEEIEKRLNIFFRKKKTNEPYKHQVDIFAQHYGIKKTKQTPTVKKTVRVERKAPRISKPKTYTDSAGNERIETVKIRDNKENRSYIEPVYIEDNREVIHQKHISWKMTDKGYRYVVRDKKTGRFVRWVK